LASGTGISVTGTYPSFTVTNTAPSSGGTVTSVAALTLGTTGTDLSSTVANGTTTPVITLQVPTASAANRGALSSTDWSTFNGKQAALVSGTNIKTVSGTSLLGSGDLGTIGVAYGGTGTATAFTAGSVVFAGTSGVYAQDNAQLFWDDTNNRLGLGTAAPAIKLDIHGTGTDTLFRVLNTGTAASDDNFLVIQTSGTSTTNTISGVFFGDGDNQSVGQLRYNHSNDSMVFYTDSTIALTLSATGGMSIVRTAVTSPAAGDGNVFSGTYTPTQVSTNTNVDSVTFSANQYLRVGNTVTVSGQITIDATTANTDTTVKMSLPIASNIGASRQLGGTGSCISASNFGIQNIAFLGDATNDSVDLRLRPSVNTSLLYAYSFTYQVI
jgi:hypothetical protein